MKRSATILATLAVLAPWALPAPPASAASSWWQLLSGSRPSNLRAAPDEGEAQELSAAETDVKFTTTSVGEVLVAPVTVGGEVVGCLGTGEFTGVGAAVLHSPAAVCEQQTGLPAAETIETPAELAELLEGEAGAGPYKGEVLLAGPGGQGAPPAGFGEGPFTLSTPRRWVPRLEILPAVVPNPLVPGRTVTLGKASAEVTSEGSGRLTITLTNLGNAPVDATEEPLVITDRLPGGADAYRATGEAGWRYKVDSLGSHVPDPLPCTLPSTKLVRCAFEGVLRPYDAIEIEVYVALGPVPGGEAGEVAVAGGGAPYESAPQTLNRSSEPVPFGLEQFSIEAEEEGGRQVAAPRAGAHPFQLTTTIVARSGPQSGERDPGVRVAQPALPRNLRFTLPAGLVGDATAVPTCEMATFLYADANQVNECPAEAAIGVSSVTFVDFSAFGLARLAVPVFNLPPERGEPARFGLMIAGVPTVIDTAVDPADSYRISAEVRNVPQTIQFLASTTTLWGVPGAAAHDASRGWNCAYTANYKLPGECEAPVRRDAAPFLRMPVSCASPLGYEAAFEPWNVAPGSLIDRSSHSSPPLGGCNREPFDPTLSGALTSRLASNPSGLDLGIEMPGEGLKSPEAETSEAQFKRAEVTLPVGMTVNPSVAAGLGVCSPADWPAKRSPPAPARAARRTPRSARSKSRRRCSKTRSAVRSSRTTPPPRGGRTPSTR